MKHKYISNSRAFGNVLWVLGIVLLALLILALIRQIIDCHRAEQVRTVVSNRTGYDPTGDDIAPVVPPYDDDDTVGLPECVLLEHLFPPVGDQGQYGTCVAWATGYNVNTAVTARKLNWSADMLAQGQNQTSPSDLWRGISPMHKGQGCSGASFVSALQVLSQEGAANMAKVPYDNSFDPCTGTAVGDTGWGRISSYNALGSKQGGIPKLGQLKAYLADSIPLVVGIRCGDNFIQCKTSKTIENETYRYTGQHAYHAIALVGYDDSRRAFRLRNSWGEDWGDKGSVWVGYRLFCTEMCLNVYEIKK